MSERLPLFPDLADLGAALLQPASLARCRGIYSGVVALADVADETYMARCAAIRKQARGLGAHRVARVVRWLMHPETLDRHGYDYMHIRAERVARAWLGRIERERMR